MSAAARGATLIAVALLLPACNLSLTTDDSLGGGPSAPQNPFVLQIPLNGQNSVIPSNTQFAWGALPGAQTYELQISLTSDFAQILYDLPNLTIPSVFLTVCLTHSTSYYWRVFARSGASTQLAGGSPFRFTTISPIFGLPGFFFLQSPVGGATSVSNPPLFSWSFSSGASSYIFQLDPTPSFSSPLIDLPNLHLNQLQCPVTLAATTTYYWRVKAGNSFGVIDSSPVSTSFSTP
jgi:hypothetical protein